MSTSRASSPVRRSRELLVSFASGRIHALSRHARQDFIEVLDTVGEHFEDHGVDAIDLRRDAAEQPRRGVWSLARTLMLLERFKIEHLRRELSAEPDYARRADAVLNALTLWLRAEELRSSRPAAWLLTRESSRARAPLTSQ